MKSHGKLNKFKTWIVSVPICLALLIASVFSICGRSDNFVNAEEASETGVRFVQIATGEDFAIGLTYDGDLYGWSLLEEQASTVGDQSATTLGRYYPTTPKKISVTFRRGPGEAPGQPIVWGDSSNQYIATTDDEIVQIAATRTTAAFITRRGHIYTWGNDVDNKDMNHDVDHPLLLRPCSEGYDGSRYEPFIVNYNYYTPSDNANTGLLRSRPFNNFRNMSLAAGENNYIFVYYYGTCYNTFVWGSALYGVLNMMGQNTYNVATTADANNIRHVYHIDAFTGDGTVKAVAGGYTVGYNHTGVSASGDTDYATRTSLALKGKNFIVSEGTISSSDSDGTSVLSVSQTVQASANGAGLKNTADILYAQDGSQYRMNGAVIGGVNGSADDGEVYTANNYSGTYYGRQDKGSVGTGGATLVYNSSRGDALGVFGSQSDADADRLEGSAYFVYNAVSLGNDIGYGISGGTLYSWGDNAYGQGGNNNASSVKSSSTPTVVGGLSNIVSVAAGKQKSPESVKPFRYAKTLTTDGGIQFNAGDDTVENYSVFNDPDYITGAIDEAGKLHVWSNNKPDRTEIKFGGTENRNAFAAVYSGYGNNLFAITKFGKAVRIEYKDGEYKQTVYDRFLTTAGTPVVGWTVSANDANINEVEFKSPTPATKDEPNPSLGSMTFFVNVGNAVQPVENTTSVLLNGGNSPATAVYKGERKSLVTSNNAGDVYRILDPSKDTKIIYVDTTATGNRARQLTESQLTPVFYLDNVKMTDTQRDNMFAYDFVYSDDLNDVGIKITPRRSTLGLKVTVEFYVARYDCSSHFQVNGGKPEDEATYFDYQKSYVRFFVANTAAYQIYDDFRANADGEERMGNSNIPLLDPNNEYNNRYSIAVQDVSNGALKLLQYLTKDNTLTKSSDAYKAIVRRMRLSDVAFPSSTKVADGNLNYYLGADVAKYNDEYQVLFADRDADILRLYNGAVTLNTSGTANSNAVSVSYNPITVSVEISGLTFDSERIAHISTDFLNLYGLYGINVAVGKNATTVTFAYDTVRFTARAQTNEGTGIEYSSNSVSSYKTVRTAPYLQLEARVIENSTFRYVEQNGNLVLTVDSTAAPAPKLWDRNVASVFSQPSVRLRTKYSKDGKAIYGDAANEDSSVIRNKYTENLTGIAVGDVRILEISDYIGINDDNRGYVGNNISFAYNNGRDYSGFNSQFPDELNSANTVVTLTGTQLRIAPTTRQNLYITVVIQRFHNSTATFGDDEKIYLTFNVEDIAGFTLEEQTSAQKEFTISSSSIIDVLGNVYNEAAINARLISENLATRYQNNIVISDYISTNTSVLVVSAGTTTTSVRVTPVSSGTAVVQFKVTVFGESLLITLGFNVSGLTSINDDITLSDVSYVYVSNLLEELNKANYFDSAIGNYGILSGDLGDVLPNAVYFTDAAGEPIAGLPSYVRSVRFVDSGARLRLRIELNSDALDTTGVYYMYTRFVNTSGYGFSTYEEYRAAGLPILETRQRLISTKRFVHEADDENRLYTVYIDFKNPKPQTDDASDWYTTGTSLSSDKDEERFVAHIPVRKLLELIGEESPEEYKAVVIKSDTKTSDYMYYGTDSTDQYIEITPRLKTPDKDGTEGGEPVTINVSVTPRNFNSSGINQILSFRISIDGISTTLEKSDYTLIWLVAFFASFGVLFIVFLIRMIIYWRKRAQQRAIIKRNQELIKLRDRVHNKTTSATREQIVKTKLKMEDPKYAKMFGDMKRDRAGDSGVTLESADFSTSVLDGKDKKSKKKKKGGKKSIAELKAELEAKKAAVLAAQNGEPMTVNSVGFGPIDGQPFGDPMPMDGQPFGADDGFISPDQGFGTPVDTFDAQPIDGEAIIFDAPDIDNGSAM